MSKPIYLDNNGTTEMCAPALKAMVKWSKNPGNASTDSEYGKASAKMLKDSILYIKKHCGIKNYSVVFTSGASESNCMLLRSIVEAYTKNRRMKPHIITSLTEHKSILDCCKHLKEMNLLEVTYVAPNMRGCILPRMVEKEIKSNTALITIMAANNELGCVNDFKEIGAIAHKHKIPFHSDFVQIFGKERINLEKNNIDAISVSFHKLHGPVGCGLLIINDDLVSGYGLQSQISGTQQNGMRGGTENVPAIAASVESMKCNFKDRKKKNARLKNLKIYIIKEISKSFKFNDYKNYFDSDSEKEKIEMVLLGQLDITRSLYHTMLISIAKNKGKAFCNIKLKQRLNKKRIVVSVGSACNTKSSKASHVLQAIRAPEVIRHGVIRISLSDYTTKKEIDKFIKEFVLAVKAQM